MKYSISFLLLSYYGFVSTVFAQSLDSSLSLVPGSSSSTDSEPTVPRTVSPKGNAETNSTSSQTDEEGSASKIPSCDPIAKNAVLKKGVQDGKNKNVLKLQTYLARAGYLKATPNGYFGLGTHSAVRAFQKKYGFTVTGIVGPYTLAKINELSCSASDSKNKATSPSSSVTKKSSVPAPPVMPPKADDTSSSPDGPAISLFSVDTNSSGVTIYNAKIKNVDAISVKAVCPPSIIEVKLSIGLTKAKIPLSDSICSKEKYLYLGDSNQSSTFERVSSQLVYIDREGLPGWFAIDASTTPALTVVQYKVKACLASICVEKTVPVQVADYFQKALSTDLSLDDVRVDTSQKLYLTAHNFNQITVRAGCPYNTEAVDANGVGLSDGATPCNAEKDIVAKQTANVTSYDKPEGVALKDFGFNFQIKSVNGQTDLYSNIELTVKACTGVQANTVTGTTLKCIEKKTYLPVYKK